MYLTQLKKTNFWPMLVLSKFNSEKVLMALYGTSKNDAYEQEVS